MQYIILELEITAVADLQNWARFEEMHPNTFKGMYDLWVYKGT